MPKTTYEIASESSAAAPRTVSAAWHSFMTDANRDSSSTIGWTSSVLRGVENRDAYTELYMPLLTERHPKDVSLLASVLNYSSRRDLNLPTAGRTHSSIDRRRREEEIERSFVQNQAREATAVQTSRLQFAPRSLIASTLRGCGAPFDKINSRFAHHMLFAQEDEEEAALVPNEDSSKTAVSNQEV